MSVSGGLVRLGIVAAALPISLILSPITAPALAIVGAVVSAIPEGDLTDPEAKK